MLRGGVEQVSQFLIESTPGNGGTANRYSESFNFMFERNFDPKNFRGSGSKVNTVKVHHKKMAGGSLEAILDYNSFPYICTGLFVPGTRAQIDTSGAYQQIFTANTRSSDAARKTFAVEIGDGTACEDYTFVQLLSMVLEASQDGFTVKSDAIARFPLDNQTLASSPTIIAPRPVERGDVDMYIDTSFGGLGGTKLTEVQKESLNIGSKFKEAFFHNSANASFADVVEIPYDPTFSFECAHNSQSRTLVNALGTNPERWIRWTATGRQIGVNAATEAVFELIQIDLKIQFDTAKPLRNESDIFAYAYGAAMMPDPGGLNAHLVITTINSIATL